MSFGPVKNGRTLTDVELAILANINLVRENDSFNNHSIPPEIREAARIGLVGEEALQFVEEQIRSRSE